ncbi:MAG: phage tail tape measure protein [Candidatus Moraniibacteriota bacterium]
MPDYDLGTASGTIEILYKGNGPEKATAALANAKKSTSKISEDLQKAGTGALLAGTTITGAFVLAVNAAGKFEKGLSGIQAVSGATAAQMEAIRQKALQLGADTQFSASQSATAMEELVKAGIPVENVLNGAADATVSLAAAGGIDLPQAATIAANAMNQFGLTAKELPKIVDRIAGAANTSAIDVSDLGQSMQQVGAVANLAGLSFDDTALAIAALGNAGIKGSDAGTSLKSMLMNLQPQTKKQATLAKELGIITEDGANKFYDAAGSIRPMSEIAGVLETALKGMSDAQKQATLETLFGSDAIRAAAIVAKTGADGFSKMNSEMAKTSAADVAAVRMKNLAGQTEQLKGSAETLAIQIGTFLIPAVTRIIQKITEWINWFTNLDSGTRNVIVTVVAVTGAVLLFLGAIIKLVAFAKTAKGAILAVKGAMLALNLSFLTNPIFLLIAAVVALVAAFVYLWKNNEGFRNFFINMWNSIKNAVMAVVNWITGTAVPWIKNAWNTIATAAQTLWRQITAIWNGIRDSITAVFNAIWSTVQTVWNLIVTGITNSINTIRNIITTVMNGILAVWSGIWNLFGPLVMAVWDLIKAIIEVAAYYIKTLITNVLNGIMTVWSAIWNGIKAVAMFVWNAIKTYILNYINLVRNIITTVMNAISAVWTSVWNAIKSFVIAIWNAIRNAVVGPINAIRDIVSRVVNTVRDNISSAFNRAKDLASMAFEGMKASVTEKITAVRDKVKDIVEKIKGFFSGAGTWLRDAGSRIIQGLIDGIKSMIGSVTDAIGGIADKIRGFLPGSPIKEGPLKVHGWNEGRPGRKLVGLVADGIVDNIDSVERAMSQLAAVSAMSYNPQQLVAIQSTVGTVSPGTIAAPSNVPTTSYGDITVQLDIDDLEAIKTVEDFLRMLDTKVQMKKGVDH